MRATVLFLIGAIAAMSACKRQEIYSKHAVPVSAATVAAASSTVTGPPTIVGRWAATRADCTANPWLLTATELDTPGQTRCTFAKLSPASAGYAADVVCKGPGAEQIGRVFMTLSGQGASRGLTLAGGPFTLPVALTPCAG